MLRYTAKAETGGKSASWVAAWSPARPAIIKSIFENFEKIMRGEISPDSYTATRAE